MSHLGSKNPDRLFSRLSSLQVLWLEPGDPATILASFSLFASNIGDSTLERRFPCRNKLDSEVRDRDVFGPASA